MKPFTNPRPQPPAPARPRLFDPWNSSSTGHQRREAPRRETDGVSDTGWRASRALTVNRQFKAQGHRVPDVQQTTQEQPPRRSVVEMLAKPGLMKTQSAVPPPPPVVADDEDQGRTGTRIFDGLVVYVNGSTFPLVSDHTLKTALATHGARVSLHLARRQVTHVILGRPAGGGSSAAVGCGGGLAGTKMDREIRRIGGQGIKYVGVEWCVYIYPFPRVSAELRSHVPISLENGWLNAGKAV